MFFRDMRHLLPTIVLAALLLVGCYDRHSEPDNNTTEISANCTIAEVRAMCGKGCHTIDQDLICVGRITSSDHEGNFYRMVVIEDATGGAEVKIGLNNTASQFPVGLLVAIRLKDSAAAIRDGVMQIGLPPQEHDSSPREFGSPTIIDAHIIRSNSVESIKPVTYDIATLDSTLCGRFVKFENLRYAPLEEEAKVIFEGYTRFIDEVGNQIFLYVDPYANFSAEEIPASTVTIEGILYHEVIDEELGEQFVIKPRFRDDISSCDSDI